LARKDWHKKLLTFHPIGSRVPDECNLICFSFPTENAMRNIKTKEKIWKRRLTKD
jgi:hypothetical protein